MNSKLATPLKFFKATLLTGFCLLILGGCSQKSTTDMKAMDGKTVEDVLKTLGKPDARILLSRSGFPDSSRQIPQWWLYRCSDKYIEGNSKFAYFEPFQGFAPSGKNMMFVEFCGIADGFNPSDSDQVYRWRNYFRSDINIDNIDRALEQTEGRRDGKFTRATTYEMEAIVAEIGSEVKIGDQ